MKRVYGGLLSLALLLGGAAATGCGRSPEQSKARFVENGKRLMEKKDYARALLEFRNAEQARPGDAGVYCLMARAYLAQEDWERGVACLRKAAELDPNNVEAQLRLGELMASATNRDVLTEAYQRLSTLAANHPEALTALAMTEWKLARKDEAENHLRTAFERLPGDLNSAVALAQVLAARGDFAGAEATLRKATTAPRASADAWVALGEFYALRGRTADAERELRHALTMEAENPRALTDLAALLTAGGRRPEAEEMYRRISGLRDRRYRAAYGLYLIESGRLEAARDEFARLNKLDPDHREARGGLVSALLSLKRPDEAERLLGEALRRNPKDAEALFQRGAIHLMNNRLTAAEADFSQVLQWRPDSAQTHYLLSRVSLARGNQTARRQQLDEALRLQPELLAARLDLASVLLAQGSGKLALEVLDAAPERQRSNFDLQVQRNWALLGAGRTAEARTGVADSMQRGKNVELLIQDAGFKLVDKQFPAAEAAAREALVLAPEDVRALDLLFRSHALRGQAAEGVRQLRAYAAGQPGSAAIQYLTGQVLLASGDGAGARTAFEAAERADGAFPAARLSLAKMDAEGRSYPAARGRLDALLERRPNHALATLWIGHIEQLNGNTPNALAAYRKVLDVEPSNPDALNNMAYLLSEAGKADEALAYAQRAKEANPNSAAIDNTLGWVLYRKGLYSMAVRYLETAVNRESSPRRLCHLSMAYARLGDSQRGKERLELALRQDPKVPEGEEARRVLAQAQAQTRAGAAR